jgi:hypothetical protein
MSEQTEPVPIPVDPEVPDAPAPVADDFAPNYVRAFVEQEVKGIDEPSRAVTHLITTNAVDRMGDIVEPKGALLDNFRKNPVVLANHNYGIESVIGRASEIKITKDGIVSTTIFRDTPLADAAYRLAKEKLGGWSIGFRPTDSHTIEAGARDGCKTCKTRFASMVSGKAPGEYVPGAWTRHFVGWEMLEYSSVAIPANQDIVNNAITRGLVSRENVDRFFVRSITPTPAGKPAAAQGPTANAVELHPVLAKALRRTSVRFAYAEMVRALGITLENVKK